MRSVRLLLAMSVAAIALVGGPAHSHGDDLMTFPKKGAVLDSAPPLVRIRFSEPPTEDSKFEVIDGCGEDLVARVAGPAPSVVLRLDDGRPGRWFVRFNVISATDGHQTKGSYTFTVAGKKDCSEPDPNGTETPGDGGVQPPPTPDDGGSSPLVPVAAGTVLMVVVAVVVRRLSSG